MNEQSEISSSSKEINSQNNYKYDKYGFIQVDSIEDLLYDKFNCYMNNKNNEFNSITSKRKIKRTFGINNTRNKDKSMKLVLNINNKEKKIYKINPFESKSIDSIKNNINKESNNNINKNNNFIKNKKNEILINNKGENETSKKNNRYDNYTNNNNNINENGQFTFRNEEKKNNSKNNDNNIKKINKNKNLIKSQDFPYREESEKNKPKNNDIKGISKLKITNKNDIFFSQPVVSPCVMSKIHKNAKTSILSPNKNKNNYTKKSILTWPNSTLCYFNRSNKIINVNIHIPQHNPVNKRYFCTKQIISDNHKAKDNSNNIIIKIINPKHSPYKYSKIDVKTSTLGNKGTSKAKSFLFKLKDNNKQKKVKIKNISPIKNHRTLKNLSRSKCLKNKEIVNAMNHSNNKEKNNKIKAKSKSKSKSKSKAKSKSKSKSKQKEKEIKPECISLNRRRKFGDKIYKNIMKKNKENSFNNGFRISIKTKFSNNVYNKYRRFIGNKEESNNDENDIYNNKYPLIRKIYGENNKNKSTSFVNEEAHYKNNNNRNELFPAINSYFH